MAVRITYFVHATTTDNEGGLATGWQPGTLSERGREQAGELGRLLANQTFDAVFCSDLQRAVETAQIAFGDRYQIAQDARLRECNYGDLTGSPSPGFKQRLAEYLDTPFANGESYRDIEKRVGEFLTSLRPAHTGGHVAIVAHQAPQLALDVLIRGRTWQQAIAEDWRHNGGWQPGWTYVLP
jgi:broad specificity phosphatase PhoE